MQKKVKGEEKKDGRNVLETECAENNSDERIEKGKELRTTKEKDWKTNKLYDKENE